MTIAPLLLTLAVTAGPTATPEPAAPPALPVMVLQDGEAIATLDVSRQQNRDGSGGALRIAYWVGGDPRLLDPGERERARAQRIFDAFRAWSVIYGIYDVHVVAAAGRPGERGRLLTLRWTRTGPTGPEAWRSDEPAVSDLELPVFAALAPAEARDRALEASAEAAAREFVKKLDARDFKAAWDSAAPQLRASGSQERFEQAAQSGRTASGPVATRKRSSLRYSDTGSATHAEGTIAAVSFVTTTGGGEGVEDVVVVLGPDKVWRVAGYAPKSPSPESGHDLSLRNAKAPAAGAYDLRPPFPKR